MDHYVSWGFPSEDLNLDTIWGKYEEFCKPQTNEVCACFDLLTSFIQGSRSVDEWYNAVQALVNLATYPPKTAKILYHDIFWFFLCDEGLYPRPQMIVMWILRNFQQAKLDSLQRKWKVPRQLHTISSKWLVTHKLCKSI